MNLEEDLVIRKTGNRVMEVQVRAVHNQYSALMVERILVKKEKAKVREKEKAKVREKEKAKVREKARDPAQVLQNLGLTFKVNFHKALVQEVDTMVSGGNWIKVQNLNERFLRNGWIDK
jgi:hypothetical protein